ncbi:hypothetical protein VE02_07762 [Pseudogymnoascus sp. 03VT05]|nr:hypothetical protein VE02_07762 [Pseudogymnoascus sp. 03VT05]
MFAALVRIVNDAALGPENRKVKKYLDNATCDSVSRDLGKVDFDAFRRAVLLTVFQCDDLLGTRELEWFWRNDAAFFRRASYERMFRSIGAPETTTQPLKQQNGMTSALSDAMDGLIMVGPQFMHAAPSPEQLEVVARNLFAREPALTQREVRWEDVSTLMNLLLRMRLNKEKWGSFYHLGDFVYASPADKELTEALVDSLTGDGSEQTVTSDQLLRAIDIVPNLQPFRSSHLKSETENRYHLGTIQQDARLALKRAEASPDSQDTSIVRLVQTLSRHPSAYIVLFSSDAVGTTPKTAIGAYFPGPLDVTITGAENEKRETQSNTSHMLFQLLPSFRLLRSGKPDISITDLIKTEGQGVSLAEIATNEVLESSNLPYWIGDGTSQRKGLRIDPQKKTAMLASGDGQWYRDLRADENSQSSKNWEVTAQNPSMDIFMVTSGVH